jgi:hypothetical protein
MMVKRLGDDRAREVADELAEDLKLIVKSSLLGAFCFMGPFELCRAVQATEYGKYVLAALVVFILPR